MKPWAELDSFSRPEVIQNMTTVTQFWNAHSLSRKIDKFVGKLMGKEIDLFICLSIINTIWLTYEDKKKLGKDRFHAFFRFSVHLERSWLKLKVIFRLLKLIKSFQKFHLFFSNKRKSEGFRASAPSHLFQHFIVYLVVNGWGWRVPLFQFDIFNQKKFIFRN